MEQATLESATTENAKPSLSGKTLFITGASRGIGLAIALRAARDGANIVIAAKTETAHPKLPGTIHTAAAAIEAAGGKALPLAVDIRFEEQVHARGGAGGQPFWRHRHPGEQCQRDQPYRHAETPMKRYDLMMGVNARGTFLCSQACLPHLKKAANPHILTLSPPLDLRAKWFAPHLAYTMAKYGMSMCVLGMAEEFREAGIAVNALWPRTIIATAALQVIPGAEAERGRTPEIVADAAWHILTRDSRSTTGNFFIDDELLASAGITDLSDMRSQGARPLKADLFVDEA